MKAQDKPPRSKHEVIADGVEFLDPPKSNGNAPSEPAYAAGEEPF